jgi:hypothetical protein
VQNRKADAQLVRRFTDTGHRTIKAMTGDRTLTIPKQGGKEICLTWALKGACNSNCRRKDAHVTYNRDTIAKLHQLMTDCGVPSSDHA